MPRIPSFAPAHQPTRPRSAWSQRESSPNAPPARRKLLVAVVSSLLLAAAVLTISCEDDTRPLLAGYDKLSGPPKSLTETFEFLRQAREQKSYLALRPYIEPAYRDEVIDFLLAVDAFNMASDAARDTVKRSCPDLSAASLDRLDFSSMFADNLEIFSRRVEVIAQREDREKRAAVVSIRVGGRSPPEDVKFHLLDGYWLYDPGRHISEFTENYRALTKTLERVNRSLTCTENVTPETVAYQYQLFVEPTIKRIPPGLPPQ